MTTPEEPETAEALMRSRFRAFRDEDVQWLLRTWHPSTRPAQLSLENNPRWRGLQIIDTVDGGPENSTGMVEFRATYLSAKGELGVMHERSQFLREDGRWFYLTGDIQGQ